MMPEEIVRYLWRDWLDATADLLAGLDLEFEDILLLRVAASIGAFNCFPSQKRLCAELEMSRIAVSRSLVRLERGGYVARRVACNDGRVKRTQLTPRGRQLLAKCEAMFPRLRHRVFGPMYYGFEPILGLVSDDTKPNYRKPRKPLYF